ncbi:mitochondrial exoribonuclease Cyt-4 [Histoplasma capsulatum]|uniref:Mitochondrial exoribonuclease Cyt-4 n=1 Tax=Ajellomyces capsulatus TaxID=5037 RepID=A0A8A1MBT0_AJECA|nr:mitochondrial exoribonuclease Cyt-4 [Histoplasma capsulatum]
MLSSPARLRSSISSSRNGQKLQAHVCLWALHKPALRSSALQITSFSNATAEKSYNLRYTPRSYRRGFHHSEYVSSYSSNALRESLLKTEISQAELQGDGDIYDYLRKWQQRNQHLINEMDPIQVPGDGNNRTTLKGDMLKDGVGSQADNIDLFDMDEYRHSLDEDAGSRFLQPGDLVVLKSESSFSDGQLAIYVRSLEMQHQFYTMRGKWRSTSLTKTEFIASKVATLDMLKILLPYFPSRRVEKAALSQLGEEGGVPRPIGAHLIELMMGFSAEAEEFHRTHAIVLNDLYNKLVADEHIPIMTLDEIAEKALGLDPSQLAIPQRWAVQRAIGRLSFFITPNKIGPFTESYTIRPKDEAKKVATVIRWTREYQNRMKKLSLGETILDNGKHPIEMFILKARRIIHKSRQSRSPTMVFSVGPSAKKTLASVDENGSSYSKDEIETFSETDKIILDYFRMWMLPPCLMTAGTLSTSGSTILRAIGLYNDLRLTPPTGYLFLQEMGVLTPWENLHVLYEQLALPGHGISRTADMIEEESNKFCENLGPDNLSDTMEALRKDWGDLPVFCVDDVHAAEIDDGFSVEPIPGSDDTYWVHVHVANPSAFVPPDHIVAKRAAEFKRSFYSPERVYSMLPPALVHKYFSLAPGRPTLTFSAKINMLGDILETNITNGYIKNIIYVTPNKVRKLFGINREEAPSLTISFDGRLPEQPPEEAQNDIRDEHKSIFYTLEKLMAARREKRVDKGALEFLSRRKSQPRIYGGRDRNSMHSVDRTIAYHYTGDPAVHFNNIVTDPFEMMESTKEDLVNHVMVLAGEVAGQWLKDRQVPVVFAGTWYHPEYSPFVRDSASTEIPNTFHLGLPRSFSSSTPTPHVSLGVDQYVRCTSPLRRYTDLIAHWQIEAILCQQANEPSSVSMPEIPMENLPFKKADIDQYIARSDWQNCLKTQAQNRSRDFWICQALFRSFYFKAAKLPQTFQCIIQGENFDAPYEFGADWDEYYGRLQPFDLQCVVTHSKTASPMQIGDLVDVELVSIDMYSLRVTVKFSRHVKRPENGALASRGIIL